jgi:hypothetical protein
MNVALQQPRRKTGTAGAAVYIKNHMEAVKILAEKKQKGQIVCN